MSNRQMVRQHYSLVDGNAKYNLNRGELDLVLKLIAEIKKEDVAFQEYTFKISELEKSMNKTLKHKQVEDMCVSIMKKPLEIEEEDGLLVIGWFSSLKYLRGSAQVIASFDPKLKPYLLDLQGNYLLVHLQHILPMKSEYSKKLYMFLKKWQGTNKRTWTVEELQEKMNVPKSFKKLYGNFKAKALNLDDINNHSDIFVEMEEIKIARKVTEIKFKITPQTKEPKSPQLFDNSELEVAEEYKKYIGNSTRNGKVKYLEMFTDGLVKATFENDDTRNFESIKSFEETIL